MRVQIKFTKNGCCSAVGNFAPGDLARIDDKLAHHLVHEAEVATYVAEPAKAAVIEKAPERAPERAPAHIKRRGRAS